MPRTSRPRPSGCSVGACLKLRADLCLREDVRASGGFRRLPRPPLTARRAGRAGLQRSDSDRCHHVLKVPREVENATACSSASAVPCPSDLRAAVADSRRLEMHARQRPGEKADEGFGRPLGLKTNRTCAVRATYHSGEGRSLLNPDSAAPQVCGPRHAPLNGGGASGCPKSVTVAVK